MAANKTMGPAQWAMLLLLSVLWGGSFFFIDVALRELPPLTLVLLRVAGGAAILRGVLRATGAWLPKGAVIWRSFFCMALINNVIPFTLLAWGQTHIASGLASILNATTPLWTVLAAQRLTDDEKATPAKLVGVCLGFSGVAVMIGAQALNGAGTATLAEFACLAAPLAYALGGIYGRRFGAMGMAPLQTATGQLVAAAAVLLPVAMLVDRPWQLSMPGESTWAAVAALAALSTALAFVLYFRLLAVAGATNLLLVTFLIPVTAIFLGWFVLGENLSPRHFLGIAFIGGGLVAIDGRLLRALRRSRTAHAAPCGEAVTTDMLKDVH
jgi:drug/metabolite transporter (DMT)-like permease